MERLDWKSLLVKLLLWQWVIIGIFTVTIAGVFAVYRKDLPPEIPIFYSKPWGADQLGTPTDLFIPIGILAVIATTTILVIPKLKLEGELKVMLAAAGMLSEIILLLGILRIIILVI